MSDDSPEVTARDAKMYHVRKALEREMERAMKHGRKLADGCDLTPSYEPNLKAIKSELRALCAAEQKVQEATP